MWYVEVIGIVATVFILVSMSIDTASWKGDVVMRIINIVGSVVFVVYGALLPAYSTAILNWLLVFINTFYLVKLLKNKDNNNNKNSKPLEENKSKADGESKSSDLSVK